MTARCNNEKIIFLIFVITALCTSNVMASEVNDSTEIPEVKLEVLLQIMQSKKAKIDIIKKNNIEITKWKEELKSQIVVAAEKVNGLKLEVSNNSYQISEETLEELKSLLNFLQDSKKTLEEDVEKISKEIDSILELISSKAMKLDQYDLIIEKQNEVIIEMKSILQTVSKI